MPPQNYAIIRTATGQASLQPTSTPTPPPDDYLLIRTVAVALNPTDWTTLDAPGAAGTVVGCDYAGVVEQVGAAVTRDFRVGDRVAGFAHGGNDAHPEHGAFARYIIAKGDIQLHIPDHVSFEEACTVGVGLTTLAYALYKVLGLPWPGDDQAFEQQQDQQQQQPHEQREILIYGGSTATGTLAIQFAKMSGYKVHATASPQNFDLVRSRGADAVYDYRDTSVGTQIRNATNNTLTLVFDCISTPSTAAIGAAALSSTPGGGTYKYANLLGDPSPRADVESTFFLAYSASGEEYIFEDKYYPADPEYFALATRFARLAERLWAEEGPWRTHPRRVVRGKGLRGLLDEEEGLDLGRKGGIRAEKLVFLVEETAWPDT